MQKLGASHAGINEMHYIISLFKKKPLRCAHYIYIYTYLYTYIYVENEEVMRSPFGKSEDNFEKLPRDTTTFDRTAVLLLYAAIVWQRAMQTLLRQADSCMKWGREARV